MGILNIRPAKRGESKAIIGIGGVSGSGKTYTALQIARGMVSKPSEIGFLDTENKRGSLYADILDGEFMIADLLPPFSPSRYSQAIKEFQDAGVKVLVIDSVSHEWEGEGGCDDIANAPKADGSERKVANWNGAKREHKRFMNTLLQCDMDVVCCLRAREKIKIEKIKGRDEFIPQGIQPIQEKNFMFELTASILMEDSGKRQTFLKMPSFLIPAFGNGIGYIGVSTGKAVRQWLNEGEKENPEITRLKSEMQLSCEAGVAALVKVWESVPKELKPLLLAHKDMCKESALEYERQRRESDNGEDTATLEDLQQLFDLKKDACTPAQIVDAERIINNKEVNSYSKLHKELSAL